jgi:hypothetical protein
MNLKLVGVPLEYDAENRVAGHVVARNPVVSAVLKLAVLKLAVLKLAVLVFDQKTALLRLLFPRAATGFTTCVL